MNKSVLLMAACIFSSSITSAADQASNAADDQRTPAIAFEKLVDTAYKSMTTDQPICNCNGGGWVKRNHTVSNVTYDVKKTDSLLNPIVGFVSFTVRIAESALVNSKEEALRTTTFDESPSRYDVSLIYSYKDGTWKFKNSRVKTFFKGQFLHDYEPSEEEIISDKFVVPLHYWMPQESLEPITPHRKRRS